MLVDGVVAVVLRLAVRRAAGLRAGRLRAAGFFAAGLLVVVVVLVVVLVFSAMWLFSPCPEVWVSNLCSPELYPTNICT